MTDIIAPPTISAFPPAPQPTDTPTEFDTKAFAKVNADVAFVPQANALAANVFNNATAAQERASAAAGSASVASGSAGSASSSASAASGSASAAAGSASSASTSAGNAAASYTSMQKLYLGPKSSPPTTDNQGGALALGAWYVNTALGSWFWWNGSNWVLGMSDVSGSFVPLAGGVNMSGFLGVPAGATGNSAPRVSEVFKKAPDAFGKAKPMGELDVGFALFTTTSGRGGDWPPETYDDPNQAWLVETTGGAGRAKQVATQLLTTTPMTSTTGRIQGSTWQRSLEGTIWGAWDRVITARTAMDQQVTINVPAGTTTYTLDPGLGGSHVVTINGTCTFNLPAGRQYGDQVTLDVISAGGVRSIGFSANVTLPKDGTGANLPFPTYVAGSVVSFVCRCIRVNSWECYYAGVH
jgi:hypothetical protein